MDLANLHNARRAQTPIVNIVGDHATYHAQYDAPLASDIAGFARPVSGWVHSSTSALTVATDGARAVAASLSPPGQIATLILPADTAWNDAEGAAPALSRPIPSRVSDDAVDRVVVALRSGKRAAILMRGACLHGNGLEAAGVIAAATGARLMCDTFAPRMMRGAGRAAVERIPYFAEQIVEFLSSCRGVDPRGRQAAGVILRLSGQAKLVHARGGARFCISRILMRMASAR